MAERIEELTPEQSARMASWAQEWIDVGLSTEPIDVERFTAACEAIYGWAGVPWHGNVVVVPNPLVGALGAPIAGYLLGSGAVGDAVYGAVRGAVRRAVRERWNSYLGGSLWPHWAAWRSYFRDVCDLDLPGDLWDRARAMEEVTRSACWWWPWGNFVMVSDRPAAIHRERVGPDGWGSHRLHCETGMAIEWSDGWGLYFIHGVQVDERTVLHPETLTWQDVLGEQNAERRRVMAERMGWDRLVGEAGCELVHEVEDPANAPHVVQLWTLPDDIYGEPVRLVTMVNASPDLDGSLRRYGLTVPATLDHAGEAIAWTFDLTWDEYRALGVAC